MEKQKNKITKLVQISEKTGQIGVLVIEKKTNIKEKIKKAIELLNESNYKQAEDYWQIMFALESGQSVFYCEKGKKIDNLVWNMIKEYEGGIISLMDRKEHTGLKTIKYSPLKSHFILLLTRDQIEKSPQGFFNYVGPMESI